MKRWLVRLPLALLALAALGLGIVGWLGSRHLVSPPRRALEPYHRDILGDPARFGLSVTSFRGPAETPCLLVTPAASPRTARKSRELRKRLGDRVPPWGEIRGTVVLLHGHRGRKEDHLPICERFCAAGFRCILPDLPGHGEHPSGVAGFGTRECELVEGIVDDARCCFQLPDDPLFLFGVSQGGAIALQTAARDPERWAGVVSVAAFADLDAIVERSAGRLHPAVDFAAPLTSLAVDLGTGLRAGFLPSRVRPEVAAGSLVLPVMIVHGEEDRFIPADHARRIHAALPQPGGCLRMVPGAGHGRVLAKEAATLYPEICEFLLRSSGTAPPATAAY